MVALLVLLNNSMISISSLGETPPPSTIAFSGKHLYQLKLSNEYNFDFDHDRRFGAV